MTFTYSGDINISRRRAIDNKTGQNVVGLLPHSGLLLKFDSMAIPADAKNVKNAHLFINYMLRPEVQATTTNIMMYPTANEAAQKYIKGYVFPTFAEYESMTVYQKPNLVVNRLQTRAYNKFKSNGYRR